MKSVLNPGVLSIGLKYNDYIGNDMILAQLNIMQRKVHFRSNFPFFPKHFAVRRPVDLSLLRSYLEPIIA